MVLAMKFKLTVLVLILIILSSYAAAECFLYQDNNYYCTDLPLEQAQRECAFYADCDPAVQISFNACQNEPACAETAIVNSLPGSSISASTDVEGLPLPEISQNSLAQLPVINNDKTENSDKADKKDDETNNFIWIILSLITLAAAGYYAVTRNLLAFLIKPVESSNRSVNYSLPISLNPGAQKKIHSLQQHHSKKVHQYQIKQFLVESGLAVAEPKKDIFHQLMRLHSVYEKRKQHLAKSLSEQERKVFENLEQLASSSKHVNNNQQAVEKSAVKIIAELRNMAGRR